MAGSIIKQYYEGLAEGKLKGKKCKDCGAVTFPPTTACEKCGSTNIDWFELSGKGQLLYISHGMAPPPNPRFNKFAPYAYGHVKLEEGVFVQGMVTNVKIDPDTLRSYFEKGPVDVTADIVEAEGLSILGFKVV